MSLTDGWVKAVGKLWSKCFIFVSDGGWAGPFLTGFHHTCRWPWLFCRKMNRQDKPRGSCPICFLSRVKIDSGTLFSVNFLIFSDFVFLCGSCFEDSLWLVLAWLFDVGNYRRNFSTRWILGSNFFKSLNCTSWCPGSVDFKCTHCALDTWRLCPRW